MKFVLSLMLLLGLLCPTHTLAEPPQGHQTVYLDIEWTEPPLDEEDEWVWSALIQWETGGATRNGAQQYFGSSVVENEFGTSSIVLDFEDMEEGDLWSVWAKIPLQVITDPDTGAKFTVQSTVTKLTYYRVFSSTQYDYNFKVGFLEVFPYDPNNPPEKVPEINYVEILNFLNGARRLLRQWIQ